MTPRVNLYALLGVTKSASKETIRQAYYGLAKKLHPDIIKLTSTSKEAEKKAEDEFKEITYAYDVLSDGNICLFVY
jgi:molecular chaperone DnaJ